MDVGGPCDHGSSPRMWGTPNTTRPRGSRLRFIPTHVGNSPEERQCNTVVPVHPHACGELVVSLDIQEGFCGSSPRMWGTLCMGCLRPQDRRFIPTHVGNSEGFRIPRRSWPVHPHACGELHHNGQAPPVVLGSSPRMWGTLGNPVVYGLIHRFIPTHVGNSKRAIIPEKHRSVHPHACGELDPGPWP